MAQNKSLLTLFLAHSLSCLGIWALFGLPFSSSVGTTFLLAYSLGHFSLCLSDGDFSAPTYL